MKAETTITLLEGLAREIRFEDVDVPQVKYNNWRELTVDEIKFEYMVEYRHVKRIYGDIFTEKEFIERVKKAKVKEVDPRMDRKIGYRSGTGSIASLKSLVSTYKFPRDVDSIIKGYKENQRIPYPLVLKLGPDEYRIMGGNTRMDVAFIMGFNPKVKIVDISDLV